MVKWVTVLVYTFGFTAAACADHVYSLIDIGDLPGGRVRSTAAGLSDAGHVVGTSETGFDRFHAFIWTPESGMLDIGALPGGDDKSNAWGVNARGQVVGTSDTASGYRAFRWDSSTGFTDLGVLPDSVEYSYGYGINEAGQVVGCSSGRSFLWNPGTGMQDINYPPGGMQNEARGINDSGQIIANTGFMAYLRDTDGVWQSLGTLGSGHATANAVSQSGQVVGYASPLDGGTFGFRYSADAGMSALPDLDGGVTYAWAWDLNDNGLVVGGGHDTSGERAVLWDERGDVWDLNDLVDDSAAGWTLQRATAINKSGWIVGFGIDPAGQTKAFLLVPEPGGTATLLIIFGLMNVRRR